MDFFIRNIKWDCQDPELLKSLPIETYVSTNNDDSDEWELRDEISEILFDEFHCSQIYFDIWNVE